MWLVVGLLYQMQFELKHLPRLYLQFSASKCYEGNI